MYTFIVKATRRVPSPALPLGYKWEGLPVFRINAGTHQQALDTASTIIGADSLGVGLVPTSDEYLLVHTRRCPSASPCSGFAAAFDITIIAE